MAKNTKPKASPKSGKDNPLAKLTPAELAQELRETKHAALNLRFRNATGQLDNTAEIKRVRRQIARINTFIRMREIEEATK